MRYLLLALPIWILGATSVMAQNPVTRLQVRFTTGNDDLREGSQLFLTWQLRGQSIQRQSIIRRRERLPDRTTNQAQVVLPRPTPLGDITEVGLDFIADRRDMMGDDEWILSRLVVTALDAAGRPVATLVDAALNKKFAHNATWRSGPLARARPEEVAFTGFEVTVETGDDDFRKESGLALEVEPTSGASPIRVSISPGRRLDDRTTWTTRAMLTPRDVPGGRIPSGDIYRVLLQYSADRQAHTVFSEPDKWEIRGVSIRGITPDGRLIPVTSSGAIRQKLYGSDYWVSRPIHPRVIPAWVQTAPVSTLQFVIFTGEDDLRGDSSLQPMLIIDGHATRLTSFGHNLTDEYAGTYASLFKDRTAFLIYFCGTLAVGVGQAGSVCVPERDAAAFARLQVHDVQRLQLRFSPGDADDDVAVALTDKEHNNLGLAQDEWEMLWVAVVVRDPRTDQPVYLTREFHKMKFTKDQRTWTSAYLPSYKSYQRTPTK